MRKENIYILNPGYDLRRDRNRVIITNRNTASFFKEFMGLGRLPG
jgi:hypothetical protein